MSPVQLSTGESVTFKGHFTHKADKLYWQEMERGVVWGTNQKGETVASGIPAGNMERAVEACMLAVILRVERNGQELNPTQDWLDELKPEDYGLLAKAVIELRKAVNTEAGKKNS